MKVDTGKIYRAEDKSKGNRIRFYSEIENDVINFWKAHWNDCLDPDVRKEVKAMLEGRYEGAFTANEIAHLRLLIKSSNFVG